MTNRSGRPVMTVADLMHRIIDLPPHWDGHPLADVVLQVTMDDEHFFAIESIDEMDDGSVVAMVVPWPPDAPSESAATRGVPDV